MKQYSKSASEEKQIIEIKSQDFEFLVPILAGESDKKDSENNCANTITESFNRLTVCEDGHFVNSKRKPVFERCFKDATIEEVLKFSYKMTFGGDGQHRSNRSGGKNKRKNGEIFSNAFQGKLAECAVCNFFHSMGITVRPDFSTYRLGKWDSSDLTINGKEISIKSTKDYGDLLLLETKDWNSDGIYIPNKSDENHGMYHFIILVRIKPSCEDIMKTNKLFYSNECGFEELKQIIASQKWSYDLCGFITHEELKYIIQNNFILPQDVMLNGTTRVDAENYYVQSGDMHEFMELRSYFVNI